MQFSDQICYTLYLLSIDLYVDFEKTLQDVSFL